MKKFVLVLALLLYLNTFWCQSVTDNILHLIDESAFPYWQLLLLVIITAIIILHFLIRRRRNNRSPNNISKKDLENLISKLRNSEKERIILNDKILKEKYNVKVQNEKIETYKQNLQSTSLQIIKKNELLNEIQSLLEDLKQNGEYKNKKLCKTLNNLKVVSTREDNWEAFRSVFEKSYPGYIDQLVINYGDLSKTEIHLCVFIRSGMVSREIASFCNVSELAVKKGRYRLRKKMNLSKNDDLRENLFIIQFNKNIH